MKTRCLRHCTGGCGRTSVASKEWTCNICIDQDIDQQVIDAVQNYKSPKEKAQDETNRLLNEILMLLKERL